MPSYIDTFFTIKQMYWTYPGPVMDLGPRCDYGMAYQINGSPQLKPEVFQCNIGWVNYSPTICIYQLTLHRYMGISGQGIDYLHTGSATRKMMAGEWYVPSFAKLSNIIQGLLMTQIQGGKDLLLI